MQSGEFKKHMGSGIASIVATLPGAPGLGTAGNRGDVRPDWGL